MRSFLKIKIKQMMAHHFVLLKINKRQPKEGHKVNNRGGREALSKINLPEERALPFQPRHFCSEHLMNGRPPICLRRLPRGEGNTLPGLQLLLQTFNEQPPICLCVGERGIRNGSERSLGVSGVAVPVFSFSFGLHPSLHSHVCECGSAAAGGCTYVARCWRCEA